MNELIVKVESFIQKYNITGTVLAGFSGGADSMCLLDIINKISDKYNLKIIALHLNHNWRGEASLEDEKNCRDFCNKNRIEFYSEKLDSSNPKTETAAREARYDFFERCSKKFNSQFIFTAHNADDNAETILYRIFKGTGIIGLEGIKEHREIYYRPLLSASRKEIEEYCKFKNLSPNIDSSNFDTKYKRNFIRHEILNRAKEINENAEYAINNLSQIAAENNEIIDEYILHIKKGIYKNSKIDTKKFLKLSKAIQNRIVYDIYQNNSLDYDCTKINRTRKFIIENSSCKSGVSCSLSENYSIFINEKFIEVIENKERNAFRAEIYEEGEYQTPYGTFFIEKCCETGVLEKDNEFIAYVNLDNLNLTLRTRCNGDIIQPLGMRGHQKLKKYLNEKKIPKHEKDTLIFLTSGNEVLWAAGLGLSDKIKAGKKVTHVLKFRKKEEDYGN